MKSYVVKRLIQMVPLLIGISIVSFAIMQMAPGDPVDLLTERNATAEERARTRSLYGLDRPLHVQYWIWLTNMLRGDFGHSYVRGRPVLEMILERLPNTLYLNVAVSALIYCLAIPIGVASALRQYSTFDHGVTGFAFLGQALPNFWFGLLLLYGIALKVDLIPVGGIATYGVTVAEKGLWLVLLDRLRYLILPVAVMGLSALAGITRYMRSSMLEVTGQDYIRTARAKGLSERIVIYKHAMRNALLPIVTIIGFQIPVLFSGSVIIENIFSWPGLGTLSVNSVFMRDYMVIMAFNVIGAALVIIGNFVADLLYVAVDPRITYD
ncbi:MAG: ABC transporter permease [Bacillota bacterium]